MCLSAMPTRRLGPAATIVFIMFTMAALTAACGKKGAPLPPLVRLPVAPPDLVAKRRGASVDVQFTVPAANTDGTRPANIERVDVYGFTGPATVTDLQLLKHGTRIGSVDVKAPRDPNATVDADEPDSDIEPPEGPGLDQGTTAHVKEELTPASLMPVDLSKDASKSSRASASDQAFGSARTRAQLPRWGPLPDVPSRTYVLVGLNKRGRKGPLSSRVAVPLVAPPPAPSQPTIGYDETSITVTWTPPPEGAVIQAPASDDVLPARLIGAVHTTITYNVYDVSPSTPPAPLAPSSPVVSGSSLTAAEVRLTDAPLVDARFVDKRIEWGTERCYALRAVKTIGGLTVESDASPPTCEKLADTFEPAPPTGLIAVASEGAINLIWDPSNERDLAGYLVLRAVAPADTPTRVTPTPIQETTFKDTVRAGLRVLYVVEAVDKAGNVSVPSNRVEEAAR